MHPAQKALLKQQVLIAPHTGKDSYQKPTYGDDVEYAARVLEKVELVLAEDGTEQISTTQFWMDGDVDITSKSRVTLPDSTQPHVLRITKPPGKSGDIDHTKVFLR